MVRIDKKCPKCGKEMMFNADFDVESPSDERRTILQYVCACGTEMTISYTDDD